VRGPTSTFSGVTTGSVCIDIATIREERRFASVQAKPNTDSDFKPIVDKNNKQKLSNLKKLSIEQ